MNLSGSKSLPTDLFDQAFCMPLDSPSYPLPPSRFINREYMIISYETDFNILKEKVPAPLEVIEPVVKFEFIRMPDSSGLGGYTESGQVIPVKYNGKPGLYVLSMYLDNEPAVLAEEKSGDFPKKSEGLH